MKKLLLILLLLNGFNLKAQYVPDLIKDSLQLSGWHYSRDVEICNNKLFFTATENDLSTRALWCSDGTEDGTQRLTDYTFPSNFSPTYFATYNNEVIFMGQNNTGRDGLWKTDGSVAGTVQIKSTTNSNLITTKPFELNGKVFFSIYNQIDANIPAELWMSDGTPNGTKKYFDMPAPQRVAEEKRVGNLLFFITNSDIYSGYLWVTDGTIQGTIMLKDFDYRMFPSLIYNASAELNGKLYFEVSDHGGKTELWMTDGTEMGTMKLRDMNGGASIFPMAFDNNLYIGSVDSLYKMNSAATSWQALKKIRLLDRPPVEIPHLIFNNQLYFVAGDSCGFELWRTDGTDVNTKMVADVNVRRNDSDPHSMVVYNNKIYFSAMDGYNEWNLYSTDGTPSGTQKLNILAADRNTEPFGLIVWNGELYVWGKFYRPVFGLYKIGPSTTHINNIESYQIPISVHPNPTQGEININYKLPNTGMLKLTLTDMFGKVVYSKIEQQNKGNYTAQLNIPNLVPGVYFARIEQGAYSIVQRVIMN